MAPTAFLNCFAVLSVALFYFSFAPITVNALAVERDHVARNFHHAHAGLAKKKRGNGNSSKRCKPRPSLSTSTPAYTPPANTPAYNPPSSPEPTTSPPPASTPPPTPSSTTSSSNPPASTPNPGSTGMGKVLIDWSNSEETSLCNFASQYTTHVYNWQMHGYGDIVNPTSCGLTYIPMVWGPGNVGDIQNTLVAGYANAVFFFNEPEQGGQANVDPATAVSLFFQYMMPLRSLGYKLYSPACTNAPAGFTWIKTFVSQVEQQGGQLDAICTHYYSTSSSDFITYMQGFMAAFPSYPILITEVGAEDFSGNNNQLDQNGINEFVQTITQWVQGQGQIESMAYFGYMTYNELSANNVNGLNSLMTDNFTPSALGYMVIDP